MPVALLRNFSVYETQAMYKYLKLLPLYKYLPFVFKRRCAAFCVAVQLLTIIIVNIFTKQKLLLQRGQKLSSLYYQNYSQDVFFGSPHIDGQFQSTVVL